MATRDNRPEHPAAASSLLAELLDGPGTVLTEVARTGVSVHYDTGVPTLPVLCVCTPEAVRLPNSLVTATLPGAALGPGAAVVVGHSVLRTSEGTWRVRRWWSPSRPAGLPLPTQAALETVAPHVHPLGVPVPPPSYDGLSPRDLIGAGPGLTPAGDDLVAGALVAAHATGDPRLPAWRVTTATRLGEEATTAVSQAMLHHALDGYATPQLAEFLQALCLGRDLAVPLRDLLALGHTSGRALLTGVLHTVRTTHLEGAA